MASLPPSPHKIHNLPVIVHYNLPSTSQTFTTLFPTPQQVYVHANATTSDTDTNEDVCGSIYLKTVVQGVITASPELHPGYPSTPDLTLYIHDPRETSLRRSRVSSALPSHLRSGYSTSPLSSSPAGPSHQPPVDVWTGKGLVSWALDEPGLGKQLITGRIVRSASFACVSSDEGLGGLAALMRAEQGEAWGIEVSLCLKSGNERMGGNAFAQVPSAIASSSTQTSVSRASSSTSTASQSSRPASKHIFPAGRPPKPVDPARRATPGRPPGKKNSTTARKKKCTDTSHSHSASHPQPHAHPRTSPATTSQSSGTPRPGSQSSDNESFPDDIPAIPNTQTLTKEQAFRLIQSPAFLNEVTRVTGVRILQEDLQGKANQPKGKRAAEEGQTESTSAKKPKVTAKSGQTPASGSGSSAKPPAAENTVNILKCWNCGRTKSAVWRTKVMEDGNSVRVCNACGLYWNKNRDMRPPSLWERVDETPRTLKARVATPSDAPASRIDAVNLTVSSSGGLKRTLSHAVEQDAKRIAMSRTKPKALNAVKPPVAASSPVRPPAPRETIPRTKLNQPVAASSPAFKASTPPPTVDTFDPVQPLPHDTPNTAIRKMLGPVMQSLAMPLSDDAAQGSGPSPQFDWNTDLSAFFDLEGFSLPEVGTDLTLVHSDQVDQNAEVAKANGSDNTTRSDDVISQLFNPSSIGNSSPAPFDFSQLPPSSPPVMSSDLGHSALLLSSPDLSPWERKTSPPKSTAKSAFTPLSEISTNEMTRSYSDMGPQTQAHPHTHGPNSHSKIGGLDDNPFKSDAHYNGDLFAGKSMEELFGQMIAQSQAQQREGPGSSTGQVEGMMDDELFSFLEKSLVNN